MGIFRSLFKQSSLDKALENPLFDMLQRKSIPELKAFLDEQTLSDISRNQFCQLALLNGDIETIKEARTIFKDAAEDCLAALDHIEAIANGVQQRFPDVLIHCDLSELRGYEYHTGLVFAAFLPGQGQDIARGGRYDDIGSVFGVARPATGFSADLLNLFQLSDFRIAKKSAILAPNKNDESLLKLIRRLREKGERVIKDLSNGKNTPEQQKCNQQIVHNGKQWVVNEV